MEAEGLLSLIATLVQDYVTGRDLDIFVVDTPDTVYCFQKGGPHLAIIVQRALVEVSE